ncbi:MAG: hypothetical protein OEV64_10775 [Desulfobulbaceae bacterium]|nr:hypothetical protein [Desulfobulbaceae bacterium]
MDIVITGLGVVAPGADSVNGLRDVVAAGKQMYRRVEKPYVGEVVAGECVFDNTRYWSARDARRSTLAGNLAVYAAGQAIEQAGLLAGDVGVFCGISDHGGVVTEAELTKLHGGRSVSQWGKFALLHSLVNQPAGEVARVFDLRGPSQAVGGACAAGNMAIVNALTWLSAGAIKSAVVLGVSEAAQGFGIFAGFKAAGALAKDSCRPFADDRDGIVVSDGAGAMVIEARAEAERRGVDVLGVLGGVACATGKGQVVGTVDDCVGVMQAVKPIMPGNPFIVAHATGTIEGDAVEAEAIEKVFPGCEVAAYKAVLGHTMGASAIIELIAAMGDSRLIIKPAFGMMGENTCLIMTG